MTMWMGIDGGGSSLRVVIVDDNMQEIAFTQHGAANPSSLGRDVVQQRIHTAISETLRQADIDTVDGIGLGIAGASYEYAEDWLRELVAPILPHTFVAPSSDVEIALVGGRGTMEGVLLLSGTGSIGLAMHTNGESQRVGGWGYLLGDEGSGYWIGAQALSAYIHSADGLLAIESRLPKTLENHLGFTTPLDVINWRYQSAQQRDVAALARLVLDLAEQGDPLANNIITEGAHHIARMGHYLLDKFALSTDTVVFAGSILTNDTALHRAVVKTMNLTHDPSPKYSAVIGAALLAKLKHPTRL